jgi:hypothetical protein
MLAAGLKVRVALEIFAVHGREFIPGSLLLRNNENPPDALRLVNESLHEVGVDVFAAETALAEKGPDLGGNRFGLLVEPRIAVAMEWPVSTTAFGSTWFLLDERIGVRTSPFNIQAIGSLDLRKYNVIVLPETWSQPALEAILNDEVRKKLRQWIEAGGTLIAVGGSAAFLAAEARGLSEVRLRQDVLDKLEAYQEAAARERRARRIVVDSAAIWREQAAPGEPPIEQEKETASDAERKGATPPVKDVEALKRDDEWKRMFSPNGAFLAADVDPDHWLSFGLQSAGIENDRLPVLVSGSEALMSRHPVQTPIRLLSKERLRVSGLLWPEAAERLADTAYATVERIGYGQLILFRDNPAFRGYTEGMARAYLNAIIFGPGLGASPSVPW